MLLRNMNHREIAAMSFLKRKRLRDLRSIR
jgi:hypothetical protein